jgi:hypothetical protein
MSSWVFSCEKGLAQGSCQSYELDPSSRGAAQGIGGCASCKHRVPYNSETENAEREYEGG